MNLQRAAKRELRRVALGVGVGDVLLMAGLYCARYLGIGEFTLSHILLSAAGGSFLAVANFAILCLTIQSAVTIDDRKQRQSFLQVSYHFRLAIQGLWVILALASPLLHPVAATAPLLMPSVVIGLRNRKEAAP